MVLSKLAGMALPSWARIAALILAGCCIFLLGQISGERDAGEREMARSEQRANELAEQTAKLYRSQIQVITKTETKYRDRIRNVYIKGETIEHSVPEYVTPADGDSYYINDGFVRVYNAAWTNTPAGPPGELDRRPSPIPLADIAAADAHNATSCHAWREQALGLREVYTSMQSVLAGEAP